MDCKEPRNLFWSPFYALFRREVKRFLKVFFQTVASPLISTLLYMLIFGVSLGGKISEISGVPYIAFLLPGLVMMATLRNAFDNSSGSIITSKFVGELEDLKISPLSNPQIAWAYSLGGLVRGLLVGIITLVVGHAFEWLAYGTLDSLIDYYWTFLFFICVGGISLGNLGLVTAILSRSIEHVSAFSTFILLPLIYLGGVFFSVDQLPKFWHTLSSYNPLLYLVNGARYAVLGQADFSLSTMVCASLLFAVLTHIAALLSLRFGSFKRW